MFIGVLEDNAPHKHHAAQLCLGLDGPLEILVDDRWHQSRFALIPANVPHQLASCNVNVVVALIDGSGPQGRLIAKNGPYFAGAGVAGFKALPHSIETARVFVDDIFSRLLSDLTLPEKPEVRDLRVIQSLEFIDQEIERPIAASELAARAGLSEGRFLHLFSQTTGLPMRRYMLWRRIIRTVDAINSGADLTTAAHLAGFSDSAHFSRTFRQTFGLSPSTIFKNSRYIQVIT